MPEDTATKSQLNAHGELIDILIKEGLLSEKQAVHASRLRTKLVRPKPLLEIVKELGYVTDEQVTAAIRKNKLSMRIGSLLLELGLISESDLEAAFQIQRTSKTPAETGRSPGQQQLHQRIQAPGSALPPARLSLHRPQVHVLDISLCTRFP
jgi:type IV pilus assembly protein PilB